MNAIEREADICLILEGTYPYVAGGVSVWVHDLIRAQSDLTFHIISILPDDSDREPRFDVPDNVVSLSHVYIHTLPDGAFLTTGTKRMFRKLQQPLLDFQSGQASLETLRLIIDAIQSKRQKLGVRQLLNSPAAWDAIAASYETLFEGQSFIDYFWTWRGLIGGMLSTLLPDLPNAKLYHTISTGYAGLLAARAKVETGRPTILTEHGIYANERRIEITSASWLSEGIDRGLKVEKQRDDVRDMWLKVFVNYAKVCYQASDLITTLYEGNQILQREDGADERKLAVIPNGIDYQRFAAIPRDTAPRRPAFALIGRVVPIKDIKTYIRACGILAETVPDFDAYVMGPTDEDPDYFQECREIVAHLGLEEMVTFTGRVTLDDWLGKIDVIVLTSISEAMPLVILEAGAAGVPTVATDVGACREMIEGRADEVPPLGHGGIVTPLSNPSETARALETLLTSQSRLQSAAKTIQERTKTIYNKVELARRYHDLYTGYILGTLDAASLNRSA